MSEDVLACRVHTFKRLTSLPDVRQAANRHRRLRINAKDQAYLHLLHEGLHRDRCGSSLAGSVDANTVIPQTDLDNWGPGGSWHVHVQLPQGATEPGFTTRPFKVLPKVREPETFLQKHGVGAVNMKGCKGNDTSWGQDACSISRLSSGWEVFCVMDGHGIDGHWPAHHATRTLPYVLQNNPGCVQMLKQGKVDAAMHHAFDKVQANLVHESLAKDIELQVAGCTALCMMSHLNQNSIWVAISGDTRAVYLEVGTGVVAQTLDHKPGVPAERERLERLGCEVVRTEHEDGFVEERVNILGTEYPGLCMSRSLGDLAVKEKGVTHEPVVVEWQLHPDRQAYILAASDGVWEFMKTEEVGQFVLAALASGSSVADVCELVLQKARKSWDENEEDYCDDVTVLLVPVRRSRLAAPRQDGGCCMGLRQLFGRAGGEKPS